MTDELGLSYEINNSSAFEDTQRQNPDDNDTVYTFANRGNKKDSLPTLPAKRSSMQNNKDIFNSMTPYRDRGSRRAFDKPYRSVSRTKPLDSIDINDEEEPDKPYLGDSMRMGSPVAERSPQQDVRSRNVGAAAASADRIYLKSQHLVQAHQ